ncbi:hypothetical protein HPP92_015963 [Vanilla planifolia]|uniref:Protein kinase domain-containing protein n=1 Tax=Vanilla planifolia TaxID=51239 RepID=A0A835QPD0_VANPL|nr:hypothetical protein HPP92_015963 [Vanilla planifolia]
MGISQSMFRRRKGITLPLPEGGVGNSDTVAGGCMSLASVGFGFLLSERKRKKKGRRRRSECCEGRENKSWLLAETGGKEGVTEPQSVVSSFRFSFGSQEAEAESPSAAATVLLLVSIEGESERSRRDLDVALAVEEQKRWRRLQSLEDCISPVAGRLVRFSYAQIQAATWNFFSELGMGASSRVYKGRIGCRLWRMTVAIKRVDGPDRETAKTFCRELLIASSLRSTYVVPLVGYCVDSQGLFLVYKYISGGSLDGHLHQHDKTRKLLPWKARYKVAVGVAQAVEYLHFGTDKCVVHRDIKPSNILLSSKQVPMLCDFGLATWTDGPSLPFLCKAVKGTFGYLAPEYFQNGKLSDRTDVYAFGVVLLELITGKKALDQNRPRGDENLALWAKPLLLQGEDAIGKLVDRRLPPNSCWKELSRMARAANACLCTDDSKRPSIDQVLDLLIGEDDACNQSLLTRSGSLTGFGSQFHGPRVEGDIGGYLALAMLGISDDDDNVSYGR